MDRMVKYKNDGLRKYPGKPLKVEQMQDGYQRIVLMKESIKKRYMCHRLVALAFIDNLNNFQSIMQGYLNEEIRNVYKNFSEREEILLKDLCEKVVSLRDEIQCFDFIESPFDSIKFYDEIEFNFKQFKTNFAMCIKDINTKFKKYLPVCKHL